MPFQPAGAPLFGQLSLLAGQPSVDASQSVCEVPCTWTGSAVLQAEAELTRTRHLLRRIRDIVPIIIRRACIILERMQQAVPVPDLMYGRAAGVVLSEGAAVRHRAAENVATVEHVDEGRRGRSDAAFGQTTVAQQHAADGHARCAGGGLELGLEVNVQGGVGAVAEGGFHGEVVTVGGPGGVHGARVAFEGVSDGGVGVGGGDGGELGLDHGVGHVVGGGGVGGGVVGDDVEVGVDGIEGVDDLSGGVLGV